MEADQFMHKYEYDAENRITNVYTSEDGINWAEDATYFYYAHGPLSRTEYGDLKVQGQDFAYTIQGWIKGVNATNISAESDPGNDGLATSINMNVGKDIYSYSLNYFNGDYKAVNSNFIGSRTNSEFGTASNGRSLFNGNISSMVTTIMSPGATNQSLDVVDVQGTAYTYDKLNRIKSMQAYANFDLANNVWLASGATASYSSTYKYDNNGNIIELERSDKSGNLFDQLKYNYDVINNQTPGLKIGEAKLRSNKLYLVNDQISSAVATDIDDQGVFNSTHETINLNNNYGYDEIGNLIRDNSEEIHKIKWNVSGKVDMVISSDIDGEHLKFLYDVQGNRIAKITKKFVTGDLDEQTGVEKMDWLNNCPTCSYTWYIRDASGNVMSIYEQKPNADNFDLHLQEIPVYGSSRVGNYKPSKLLASRSADLVGEYTPPSPDNLGYRSYAYNLNLKYYELSNQLDNVLTVVSDYRTITAEQYSPIVWSSQDYYPFGSIMEGRGKAPGVGSRYGFNGKEKDVEWNKGSATYDYGFRIYDPRIGKFLSVDPLTKEYPWYTPYQFAGNTPIQAIDLDGLEEYKIHSKYLSLALYRSVYLGKDGRKLDEKEIIETVQRWRFKKFETADNEKWATEQYGYTGQIVEIVDFTKPFQVWGWVEGSDGEKQEVLIYSSQGSRIPVIHFMDDLRPVQLTPMDFGLEGKGPFDLGGAWDFQIAYKGEHGTLKFATKGRERSVGIVDIEYVTFSFNANEKSKQSSISYKNYATMPLKLKYRDLPKRDYVIGRKVQGFTVLGGVSFDGKGNARVGLIGTFKFPTLGSDSSEIPKAVNVDPNANTLE